MMVEGESKEVSEDEMLEAIKVGHSEIKVQCKAQLELAAEVGATEKRTFEHEPKDLDFKASMKEQVYNKLYEVAKL